MHKHSSFPRPDLTQKGFTAASIEHILGSPFKKSSKINILESGQATFQKILDTVSSARVSICIEFYIFKDDDTGKKLARLLKEKVRQGVKVYVLYDHFGSFLTSRGFWSDLKKAGINIRVSNPIKWSAPSVYFYRNHKKLLIIDGTKAFIGGFNIADEYHGYFKKSKKTWRDTGIYLEGPISVSLLNIFRKSWKTWKGDIILDHARRLNSAGGVSVVPIFANSGRARRKMRRLLIYSIRNAKESIFITTAYFTPSRRILRALESAARRGVSLKLMLPGVTDIKSVYYAGRTYYRRLLKAGVEIFNYKDSVLHSKFAVFDRQWSIIGSTNLDKQSLRRNEESNVGILDGDFSRRMIDIFQKDLLKSIKIDLDSWIKRPFYQKILERIFFILMKKI